MRDKIINTETIKKHLNDCIIEAIEKKKKYKEAGGEQDERFIFWKGYLNALKNTFFDIQNL